VLAQNLFFPILGILPTFSFDFLAFDFSFLSNQDIGWRRRIFGGFGVRRPAEFRDIAQLARVKLEQIDDKMRALRSMRRRLLTIIDRIETVSSVGCPGSEAARARMYKR